MRLTKPNPEFSRLVAQTPEGMMFWAGTCTDQDATCADCKHYGYTTVVRNDAGNAIDTHKYPTSCALYHKHTGRHGKSSSPKTSACKYFENREDENTSRAAGAGDEVHTIAPKGEGKMDLSKYAGSRFIKLADVAGGPKRKIVADVVEGSFDKPLMKFTDGTQLSLNKTNVNILLDLFGSADSKYVVGKLVELYAGTTKYQGADKPSVLLRGVESEIDDLVEGTKIADPPKDHPALAAPFSDEISDEIPF